MKPNPTFFLAIVCIVAFAANLFFLSRFPLVLGHDAAYYLSRTEQFKSGALNDSITSTPPVFFAIAAFFSNFFELNFSINLVAVLFSALLGISVFLLARLLLKDNWIALAIAMFVLFSRQEIILLTELKKNVAGLFFVPLFFYFFFKASENKKFLLGAIVILLLGFLTHKTAVGIPLLVLLAFVPMQLAFGRKQTKETKNFAILALAGIIAFLLLFLSSETTAASIIGEANNWLNEIRDAKFSVNLSGYHLLFFAAIAGLFYCFARAKKQHLFFAAWFLVGLWASFPFVSGAESWRFVLLLLLPIAFLSGVLLQEIKQKFGKQKAIAAFAILFLFSAIFWLGAQNETVAVFTPQDYSALVELNAKLALQKPCVVFAAGTTFYWAEYLLKNCQIRTSALPDVFNGALSGPNAFVLADAKPEKRELELFDKNHFVEFARAGNRILFKPIKIGGMPVAQQFQQQGYNFDKLLNPFALLFFPTELPLLSNVPFALPLRVFFGIPVSFAVFGIILFLLKRRFFISGKG